jgi:hypothetical protein
MAHKDGVPGLSNRRSAESEEVHWKWQVSTT